MKNRVQSSRSKGKPHHNHKPEPLKKYVYKGGSTNFSKTHNSFYSKKSSMKDTSLLNTEQQRRQCSPSVLTASHHIQRDSSSPLYSTPRNTQQFSRMKPIDLENNSIERRSTVNRSLRFLKNKINSGGSPAIQERNNSNSRLYTVETRGNRSFTPIRVNGSRSPARAEMMERVVECEQCSACDSMLVPQNSYSRSLRSVNLSNKVSRVSLTHQNKSPILLKNTVPSSTFRQSTGCVEMIRQSSPIPLRRTETHHVCQPILNSPPPPQIIHNIIPAPAPRPSPTPGKVTVIRVNEKHEQRDEVKRDILKKLEDLRQTQNHTNRKVDNLIHRTSSMSPKPSRCQMGTPSFNPGFNNTREKSILEHTISELKNKIGRYERDNSGLRGELGQCQAAFRELKNSLNLANLKLKDQEMNNQHLRNQMSGMSQTKTQTIVQQAPARNNNEEIRRLKEKIAIYVKDNQELEEEFRALKRSHEMDRDQLMSANEELKIEMGRMRKAFKEAEKRYNDIIEEKIKDNDKLNQRINELEFVVGRTREELDTVNEEKAHLEIKISNQTIEIRESEKQRKTFQVERDEWREEARNLKERLEASLKERDTIQLKNRRFASDIELLKAKILSFEEELKELAKLREIVEELRNKIKEKNSRIKHLEDLEDEIEKMRTQEIEYKSDLRKITIERDELLNRLKAMSGKMKVDNDDDQLKSDITHLENKIKILEKENERLNKENKERNLRFEEIKIKIETENKRLSDLADEKKASNKKLRLEIDQVRLEFHNMKKENIESSNRLKGLEDDLENLRNSLKEAEDKIKALKSQKKNSEEDNESLSLKIQELKSKISQLQKSSIGPISDKNDSNGLIDTKNNLIKTLKQRIMELEANEKSMISLHNQKMAPLSTKIKELTEKNRKLELNIADLTTQLKHEKTQNLKIHQKLLDISSEIDNLKRKLNIEKENNKVQTEQIKSYDAIVKDLKLRIEVAEAKIENLNLKINSIEKEKGKLESEVIVQKEAIIAKNHRADELRRAIEKLRVKIVSQEKEKNDLKNKLQESTAILQTTLNSRQVLINEKHQIQLLAEERLKENNKLTVFNNKVMMKLFLAYNELSRVTKNMTEEKI